MNQIEVTFLSKNGKELYVEGNINAHLKNGKFFSTRGIFRDITFRKLAEEQILKSKIMLQAVFDGISNPLIMMDQNLCIKMLNMAAADYYHAGSPQDVIGKTCYKELMGRSKPCEDCLVPLSIRGTQRFIFERSGVMDPDRVEEVIIFPFLEGGGKGTGAIVHVSDITEKKRVEEQLIRADRLSSLGQLSGGIAHEIRNPLAGINLFVDILCDKEKFTQTEKALDVLNEIRENINKIDAIIKRVLDFAKPLPSSLGEVDINTLINDNLKLWSTKIRNSEIELDLALKNNIPLLKGDPIELQQVINNLVLNAIEAMEMGGKLGIQTMEGVSSYHQDRDVVIIEVKNTGPGIDPEHTKDIFNPFFTTKPTGTGLGLSISHQIVKRHGGILSFESKPDKGTTFIVELPAILEE